MKKPLDIFICVPRQHTASFYYRLQVPVMTAKDAGMNVRVLVDTDDANIDEKQRIEAWCECDINMMYHPTGEAALRNIRGIQSFIPSKREGNWKWPPTVVIDTDDNLFEVSPLNPAYKNLGVTDGMGNRVPITRDKPMEIGVVEDGEKRVLYTDGVDGFSLADNRHRLEMYRKVVETADCVTCSTDAVEEYVREHALPRRTKVFPNLVRMDHYEQVDIAPDKQIKILWQGGASHYEDLFPLRQAVGRVTKKYPQVHWIFWGALYNWVTKDIPPERYTHIGWHPYGSPTTDGRFSVYRLRLAMIGHDINLAPLQQTKFNRCRTAIKFYESSVLKKPAATLAQRSGAYMHEIKDGETGLLFDDPGSFEERLCSLIENPQKRRFLGSNAKDWVAENRDAFKHVPKMVSFFEELREERKTEQPRFTDEHWDEIEQQIKEADEKEAKALEEKQKELEGAAV